MIVALLLALLVGAAGLGVALGSAWMAAGLVLLVLFSVLGLSLCVAAGRADARAEWAGVNRESPESAAAGSDSPGVVLAPAHAPGGPAIHGGGARAAGLRPEGGTLQVYIELREAIGPAGLELVLGTLAAQSPLRQNLLMYDRRRLAEAAERRPRP